MLTVMNTVSVNMAMLLNRILHFTEAKRNIEIVKRYKEAVTAKFGQILYSRHILLLYIYEDILHSGLLVA